MDMNKIEYGAFQAINNCLCVKPGEQVCIVTDLETKHIANALEHQTRKMTTKVKVFIMEDFGSRPDDGINPIKFPDEIAEYLRQSQVSLYCARGKKGELPAFRIPMLNITDELMVRHGHMPNVNNLIMEMGMNSDYAKIKEINAKILSQVSHAKKAHVTTDLGTDLHVDFHPDWKWINCDGNIQPGQWTNLPDGEVFTCAYQANGMIVVDGVLGDYMSSKFGPIAKTPLTLKVENGRMVSVSCPNKELEKEVLEYTKQDENANRLAEFAIGTNIGLDRLVGILLQDEKFPSVHVAFGHGYAEKTGSSWTSSAHLDMVITKTTIDVDGKRIMEKGKFLI